ncbi:hypothetical protein [Streptomyces pactum]|uniref:hypothetical protein n=1 Tax=Streptomyces pactum TaxID=68249 RepID=UPI0036F726E3
MEVTTSEQNPAGGCLVVQGAPTTGRQGVEMRAEPVHRLRDGEEEPGERFERAQREGDLPQDVDAGDLARYLAMVSYGISVQASGGAGREELHRVVDIAPSTWPGGGPRG